MNYDVATIKREYEQKRINAINLNQEAKELIYKENPKLIEIEREIRALGIEASKCALFPNDEKKKERIAVLFEKIDTLKSQEDEIIKKNKLILTPKFECSKCNDTGYITSDGKSTMCSCMKQRIINEYYNKSNLNRLSQEKFDNFDESFYSDTANKEKYNSKLSPRENIIKNKEIAKAFIKDFEDESTKNLLFIGTAGTGKTFLSSCIANEVISKGHTVLYQTAPILLDSIFKYKYKDGENNRLYDDLFNVDLLIIDDLGTENTSAAKFSELFSLINSRILNPKTKTIISSNLTWNQLSKTYDDRIISRLIGYYDICMFFGNDIRLKKVKDSQSK
ncbi:MAG: ATP-binding protein [Clostridia bacterium]|nr:ATP-binding protein [Clostridia bacterium]